MLDVLLIEGKKLVRVAVESSKSKAELNKKETKK